VAAPSLNRRAREFRREALGREGAIFEGDGKWYLGLTMAISIGIHVLIGVYLSTVTVTRSLTVTDLTFQDSSEPLPRSIPRPRPMLKELPNAEDIADLRDIKVSQRPIPPIEPIRTESVQRSRSLGATFAGMTDLGGPGEKIEIPVVPGVPVVQGGTGIGQWTPKDLRQIGNFAQDYLTPQSYLEMVKLKIERNKEYPEKAKTRQIQGRVTVHFVITAEGELKTAQITKSSMHATLDDAAVKAVKNAAPFPKPPARFFKGEIPMTITVVFELM
jgi:periplasmic protein TonB